MLSLLVNGESVEFVDIARVKKITFCNELFRNDLHHLLNIMLQAKKKDLKSVTGISHSFNCLFSFLLFAFRSSFLFLFSFIDNLFY